MADDNLDTMLQGKDNPPASPADNSQPSDSTQVNPIEQQSAEEVEFNKLSGNAQDRFKEVWARARSAEEQLEAERQARSSYVPPAPTGQVTPDQKSAIETLANFGIATDAKVDAKISQGFNALRWDFENTRLESKYSGTDGEPQYVREEVEDYIRKHPQYSGYAPEDVFLYKMFPDEFRNLDAQAPKKTSSTLRPTKTQVMGSAISPENVEEMVRTHDQQWYNDHIDEINRAVSTHTKQFNPQGQMV